MSREDLVARGVPSRLLRLSFLRIRSNVLSPGATETPILEDLFGSKEAAETGKVQLASATPLGRMGRPDEIAAAVLDPGCEIC